METGMSDGVWEDEPLWEACGPCGEHLFEAGSALLGAFASVGIEKNLSTYQMATLYFHEYHHNGHKDKDRYA